ncbi:MAG: hypothetical protein GXP38_13600, partial [Chloroflexi bacterium]|nr:hypothetical protein [Chloroflexota bacterium]
YEIVVSNIGNTDVVSATLQDTYETTYLDFSTATPAPVSSLDDGVLDWTNIGPIAYGSAVTVTVEFTAALSTEPITGPPADRTINTATVTDVVDENGNSDSANNYPSDDPSTPDDENPLSDTANVEITDPGVAIEKGLVIPADGDTIVGAEVVYTITVTNTGDTLLQTVPLSDTYDSTFLSYGYGGVFSSPASDDNNDDGSLAWANVGPLAVQASTTITVHFTANASTQNEVNNQTINYAAVHDVVDENGDTVPADQAQAPVEIVNQGVIGDYVWYDTDGDGIQDVNESGLGNVTIDLKDGGGSVVATVATDADGGYIFTHLPADNYTVDITDNFGIIAGLTPVSGPESQIEPYTVHLGPGEIYREADFAYVLDSTLAIVGDTVWYDPNQNGKRDAGEAGIQGVTVTLFDATTGTSTGHYAVTNINGNYLIGAVPAGTYYVQATAGVPAGASPSSGAPSPSAVFVVVAGDHYLDADIGYVREAPSEIAGTVWDDSPNENGLLDEAGNPGIPGVSVDLLDTNSKILATTTSDSNGDFSFPGLPAGTYQVQVSDTQNVLDDYVPTLIIGGTTDNTNKAQPYSVTLGTGMIDTTADFGYVLDNPPDESGIIGNQVWYDRDGDGVYEPSSGDVGVEGVTVDLLNALGQVITSTVTGASGDYVFTRLAPATYQVQVSDDYGVLAGFVDTAFPLDQSADNNNKHQPYTIVLPSAGINMSADFGYTAPAALGDFLWYDANNNGLQDVGEPGLANVTLDLYDAGIDGAVGGGDDTLLASTVSDADGGYLFPNLSPGSYYVDVTDLNSVLTTFSLTSGPQSQTDPSAVVPLSPGTVNKDIDFGYVQIPSNDAIIGDTVFYDGNGDGVQQPGEPGIPAVIVCATPDGGGSPTCDTSDSNGHYLLDVVAGAYTVAPTNPPLAYTATTSVPHSVTVTAGDQYLDADFGYHSATLMGTIGDFVFEDVDASGDYSATVDAPFKGVSVDLIQDSNADGVWDDSEAIIATTTTDENGQYLFSGVPTDDYLVHVSDTNAVLIDYVKAPLGAADTNDNNQADPYALNLGQGASV